MKPLLGITERTLRFALSIVAAIIACFACAELSAARWAQVGIYTHDLTFGHEAVGGTGFAKAQLSSATVNVTYPGVPDCTGLSCPNVPTPAIQTAPSFLKMQVGKTYTLTISGALVYSGTVKVSLPACYQLVVDGATPAVIDGGSLAPLGNGPTTYSVVLEFTEAGFVNFGDSSKCGDTTLPQLVADGERKILAWVDGVASTQWSFEGASLGCKYIRKFIYNGNSYAVIQSGHIEGELIAKLTDGSCEYVGRLALVCASGGCDGPRCTGFGKGQINNNQGIDFRLTTGGDDNAKSAGAVRLIASVPSTSLATPASLSASLESSSSEWIWDQSATPNKLRQVKSPTGLIDVATISAFKYELRCYKDSDINGSQLGVYTVSGGATPVVTWTVQNPDISGATYNQLWITENRTGMTAVTMKYTYTSVDGKWTLEDDQGLSKQTAWESISGSTRTKFEEVLQGSTVVSRRSEKFEPVGGVEVIKEIIAGQGTSTNMTVYSYYPSSGNSNANNNNQLKQIEYHGGRWERFDYDAQGRVTTKWESWLDQAPTSDGTLCRSTEYSYAACAPSGWGDTGTYRPDLARTTIIKILGDEVSRSYLAAKAGTMEYQTCPDPGMAWDAAGNERRIVTTYTAGAFEGKVSSVTEVNGTKSIYTYTQSGSDLQTIVDSGQPNGAGTSIVLGTRRTEIISQKGLRVSMAEIQLGGSANGSTLASESYSYVGALSETYTVYRLNGTTEEVANGCCGTAYTIDADGRKVETLRDALNRDVATRTYVDGGYNAITVTNLLDAAGRILETRRIGTNGNTIVLQIMRYDVLGNLTKLTNALGGATTFAETLSSGKRIVTTTFQDTGTKIETYYRDGRLETVVGSAISPVKFDFGTVLDTSVRREYSLETRLDAFGSVTSEWTRNLLDGIGREYKRVMAKASTPYPFSLKVFNNKGQLTKSVDEDGVTLLSAYDALGTLEYSAVDLNNNGVIDLAGTDRVTRTVNDVYNNGTAVVRRTRRYEWTTPNVDSSLLISTSEASVDGLRTWLTSYGLTRSSRVVFAGSGNRYSTNTAPDGSVDISASYYGRLVSSTRRDSTGAQLGQTSVGYDAHGRQSQVTDARNGTTTMGFNVGDLVVSVTSPAASSGLAPQVQTSDYDQQGRLISTIAPDGGVQTIQYFASGLPKKRSGSRTFPVEYYYDPPGRMIWMKTWKGFASDSGTNYTVWNYNPYRGWLDNKRYSDGKGPDYTYSAAGRLSTRQWARGTTNRLQTTYSYNGAGDLYTVDYSDSTPDVTYGYDRRGRRSTVSQNGTTTTLTLHDSGLVTAETMSGGILGGYTLNNAYDSLLRRTGATAQAAATNIFSYTYTYDTASRLSSVGDGTRSATYAYLANSPLVEQTTFKDGATVRMVTTRKYDNLNRLTSIGSGTSASAIPHTAYNYAYNEANQRVQTTQHDSSYWVYEYDALGQVTSGKRFWADGTLVAGQQFEYRFDDIGNRTLTQTGGDSSGLNLRVANYTANGLNQYSSRDVPRYIEVQGIAEKAASVSVNGSAAGVYRKDEYFRKELDLTGANTAVWQSLTIAASGGSPSSTGNRFLAPQPESFTYDDDGNTLTDGRWTYVWDAENRLTSLTSLSSGPTGSRYQLNFVYDAQGRRIQKTVSTHNGTSYVPVSTNRFLYDGWNVTVQLEGSTGYGSRLYLWGLDLSGTEQGAGGVGGLVAEGPPSGLNAFIAYDGNGNVTTLVGATDGLVTARYEYGPFGEIQRATGSEWQKNPFRFSTKWQDDESDLLYYGSRFANSVLGRWLSRDGIELQNEPNEYSAGLNNLICNIDFLGFATVELVDEGIHEVDIYEHQKRRYTDNPISIDWHYKSIAPASHGFGISAEADSRETTCTKKDGKGFRPRFKVKYYIKTFIMKKSDPHWTISKNFMDPIVTEVFATTTSVSRRFAAVKRHEEAHRNAFKNQFPKLKKEIETLEKRSPNADGTWFESKDECVRYGQKVLDFAIVVFLDIPLAEATFKIENGIYPEP